MIDDSYTDENNIDFLYSEKITKDLKQQSKTTVKKMHFRLKNKKSKLYTSLKKSLN